MTVEYDAKSLSDIGIAWYSLSHSREEDHTGTGDDLWATVPVLVRRNDPIDPTVTATYGEIELKSEGRIWLDNLPAGQRTHSFIEVFSGRVTEGTFTVKVTVSSGTRFAGEYRFACLTHSGVARAGKLTTVYGSGSGDDLSLKFSSVSGRRAVVCFAHESRTAITDLTATERHKLDLFLAVGEGIVGDVAGASTVTVTAERAWGKRYCGAALDLIAKVASNTAQLSLSGATPLIEVVKPPVESPTLVPVLTLAGGFNYIKPYHLKGELFRTPYQQVKIPYKNYPLSNSFAQGGVDMLDDYLHRYVGTRILVVGHSMGAQVIYKWLRQLGETSDIDPTEVTFICTGNLERKYNGFPDGGDYPGGEDGTGLPDGAWGYRVIDIARQYDFWADHPNDTDSEIAMRNVDPSGSGLGLQSPVHSDYGMVSPNPDDARNFSITEDTITYVWCPTYPAPLIDDEAYFETMTTLEPRDDVVRTEIEAAYTRPVTIPDPPPVGVLDQEFPWGWNGTEWVRVTRASVDTPTPTDSWWLEEGGS